MKFIAQAINGQLAFSEYTGKVFRDYLRKNEKIRLEIKPITPESNNMRRFFEGAVVPLIAYYQEVFNHRNHQDCEKVREWLKLEFNGEAVIINGKQRIISKSTKGQLREFLDRVIDWMNDNGYQTELLNPDDYKRWRDELYSFGEDENYIDYLVRLKKLK